MKHLFCILAILAAGHGSVLLANNIAASNAVTTGQNTTAGTNAAANYTLVDFDLSWDNSWRASTGPSNRDAAWVFVKFMVGVSNPVFTGASSSGTTVTVSSTANLRVGMPVYKTAGTGTFAAKTVISSISSATQFVVSASPTAALSNATIACQRIWEHASLDATAGNHTAPVNSTISVPSDSTGVFIYRSANGTGSVNYQNVQLRWQYGINGVPDDAVLQVKVFAIETVWVPQASFYLGSGGTEPGSFTDGSWTNGNTVPFQITSESALGIDDAAGRLWGTSSINDNTIGNAAADPEATLAAAFPKGYAGFYCMKYEISQGDYRDFLNTLTYTQQTSRAVNVTGSAGDAALSNTNTNRNGIDIQTPGVAASFTPAVYACNLNNDANYNDTVDGEWIACNFINWLDGCAYVDWAGLRPMTELEYEKACRGDQAAVSGEYAWGTSTIHGSTYAILNNPGENNESPNAPSTTAGNASYSITDGAIDGPLRVGLFATASSSRMTSGGSYYGIMEMSGNLWERAVTIGNATGRNFTGLNGNGQLSPNGDANQSLWPGISGSGGTLATGSGLRGGMWAFASPSARVSDRNFAAFTNAGRYSNYGFRGVRVFP
jgi:formylglycine-generating enzyme required for sulfatase activity